MNNLDRLKVIESYFARAQSLLSEMGVDHMRLEITEYNDWCALRANVPGWKSVHIPQYGMCFSLGGLTIIPPQGENNDR